MKQNNVVGYSKFSDFDIELFKAGKHYRLYELFGNHEVTHDGINGIYFAVWAPNAEKIQLSGNFNHWNPESHALFPRWDSSGIWEGFVPNLQKGELYKFIITTNDGRILEKGDPFANFWELRPKNSSITWNNHYTWNDNDWMRNRHKNNGLKSPFSVYEMHLGSWKRNTDDPLAFYSYAQIEETLVPYLVEMGFTHVEFMPVMEHPFDGSWGYQGTGYFAPSSRFGDPQDFMHLIEALHNANIGVILDWVPSHFPLDAHGLFQFDGSCLYEHEDFRKGFHPDWKSYIFNLGRNEVKSFLLSNALYWLDKFHIDGLRVDAVASMLYLDYSRKEGEWIPNELGGNENLESISFFKEFNEMVYKEFPDVQTIAEESTNWPGVSRPTFLGGLGFGMKWMMGWMNDCLKYFERNPYFRQYHQNEITFSLAYAFSENFMLPLSHDEVVHGKRALINKMPGDEWQRFANLRLLYFWMFVHPGAKLLFMGCEFAQTSEWNHDSSLDWHLLQYEPHQRMLNYVKSLNKIYKSEPALYQKSFEGDGFEWLEFNDNQNSVLVLMRKGYNEKDDLVIVLNLTPTIRYDYRIGLPRKTNWVEIFNSDSNAYWGSNSFNSEIYPENIPWQSKNFSTVLNLPPLAGIILKGIE